MKRTYLMAITIFAAISVYSQNIGESIIVNKDISKEDFIKKINKWVVNSFYQYNSKYDILDKSSDVILVRGNFTPKKEGMISTTYNIQIPHIEFAIEFKYVYGVCIVVFKDLNYRFITSDISIIDIKNIAVLESSTAEIKAITDAGLIFRYSDDMKNHIDDVTKLKTDSKSKSIDQSLKRKERANYQKLYDQYSSEYLVFSKAYYDMKLFGLQLIREIRVNME